MGKGMKVLDTGDLEWGKGFREAVEWVQGGHESLFITGRAGSGKSTLLRYLTTHILCDPVVLAPTGVAALAIGGETLHSFFRFPPRVLFSWDLSEGMGKQSHRHLSRLETLVIDEISMVRADVFDGIEYLLRKHGPEPGMPFGGVRLLVFGDLFQLPPVVNPFESEALLTVQTGPWFFQSPAYRKIGFRRIFLESVYRQNDSTFLDRLESARLADPEPEDLEFWNRRVKKSDANSFVTPTVVLTATNVISGVINGQALAGLTGMMKHYQAEIEGEFDTLAAPVPEILSLRIGAQIMFQRNHPERLWVNGTMGTITGLDDDAIWVELTGKFDSVRVSRELWKKIRYEEDPETGRIREKEVGRCKQFPLKPAWAITVHKSQGQEFERVHIDLGRGSFAHGQAYVALSRCVQLAGLSLQNPLRREDFKLDPAVRDFME